MTHRRPLWTLPALKAAASRAGHAIAAHPRSAAGATAIVLAVTGALVLTAGTQTRQPPAPGRDAAQAPVGISTPSAGATPSRSASKTPKPSATLPKVRASLPPASSALQLAGSRPVRLEIPALGISSSLTDLGLNPDGTVQVPPLDNVGQAGWYRYSATPGVHGSSVVLGHIDSAAAGRGVFYYLATLRPGDEVDVRLADGITAVFRVDRVAEYPKSSFPTQAVYGNTAYSSLKLVTCGGAFDPSTGNYLDNIIAFTTLVGSRT